MLTAEQASRLTVEEVVARWPQVMRVFMRYRMACVGCDLAVFETLAEAVAAYGLSLEQFLAELQEVSGEDGDLTLMGDEEEE